MNQHDNLDNHILAGIQQAKAIRSRQRKNRRYSAIAASILIPVLFTFSVRLSPAFAAVAKQIPGLSYIVDIISYDRGIRDVVDNNYVQQLDLVQEHDGIKLTLKHMICDTSRLILFYSIEDQASHQVLRLREASFKDGTGNDIQAGYMYDDYHDKPMKKFENRFELNLAQNVELPSRIQLDIKLSECAPYDQLVLKSGGIGGSDLTEQNTRILPHTFHYEFGIDTEKIKKMIKTYPINRTVEVDGQRILMKSLTITPTQAMLAVHYDKDNTKRILGFDDLALEDESGERWSTITNGVTAYPVDDDNTTLIFQSNYFHDPKELYVTAKSIRAIDKDKSFVIIDPVGRQLVTAPVGLKLEACGQTEKSTQLEVSYIKDPILDDKRVYLLFSDIHDSNGRTLELASNSGTGITTINEEQHRETNTLTIDNKGKDTGLIYLKLYDYPLRIDGSMRIRVK